MLKVKLFQVEVGEWYDGARAYQRLMDMRKSPHVDEAVLTQLVKAARIQVEDDNLPHERSLLVCFF